MSQARILSATLLYLVLIVGAEAITNFYDLVTGLVLHALLLAGLIVHSALIKETEKRNVVLALCLAPLTRILSLSMPLAQFPTVYWYLVIYPTLFLAALIASRRLDYSLREIGLNLRKLPWQLAIAMTGIVFGMTEYYILRPEPLVTGLSWQEVWLPVIALIAGTGFVEEFVFRGVMQRASVAVMGWWGIVYVALLFAALHFIHHSVIDIIFVFIVGLFFGWAVNRTGSLLGVTLAHGITNTLVYVVLPFFV